jgi:hypothetical protein
MKYAFLPVSIVFGLVAGLLGRKVFEQAWGLVKGLTDHGARRSFARMTGTWPGEEAPEPE